MTTNIKKNFTKIANCRQRLEGREPTFPIEYQKRRGEQEPSPEMPFTVDNQAKIKPLSYRELRVSFERLIRFKSPFDKIERVYREIIIKHSIEPKINSKNFRELNFCEINYIFKHIWDESVAVLGEKNTGNYGLNLYLAFEEMKTFSAGNFLKSVNLEASSEFNDAEKLFMAYKMDSPPNLQGCLDLLACNNDLSENAGRLAWLSNIIDKEKLSVNSPDLKEKLEKIYLQACNYRKKTGVLYPVELLVLVEGITEEILLPVFSEFAGVNFKKNGIKILSSGGKNQVLRLYKKLSREINLPILMLFDSDASKEAEYIKNSLRSIDDIYVIAKGEFEDILPDKLICKTVNVHYRLVGKINLFEIAGSEKKSHTLMELWKKKGFGEFKKAEFARIVADNISKKSDMSEELETIFSIINSKIFKSF